MKTYTPKPSTAAQVRQVIAHHGADRASAIFAALTSNAAAAIEDPCSVDVTGLEEALEIFASAWRQTPEGREWTEIRHREGLQAVPDA